MGCVGCCVVDLLDEGWDGVSAFVAGDVTGADCGVEISEIVGVVSWTEGTVGLGSEVGSEAGAEIFLNI